MTKLEKDTLFVLAAPFEDGPNQNWFCTQCAMLEGALLANPNWNDKIAVKRVAFPRPRPEIVALVGEEHQGCPVLVLRDGAAAPYGGKHHGERVFVKDPIAITAYLAQAYGGAAPHP
jgi:hypothetical protein